MSQINSNTKDDFQVVFLLSCFVGHPVDKWIRKFQFKANTQFLYKKVYKKFFLFSKQYVHIVQCTGIRRVSFTVRTRKLWNRKTTCCYKAINCTDNILNTY